MYILRNARTQPKQHPRWSATREWPARAVCAAAGLCAIVAPPRAWSQGPPAFSDWRAELQPAIRAYLDGDFTTTQQYCERVARAGREGPLARDAAALQALAMMRGPSRDDRLAGRGRLAQLQREHPILRRRPECLMAFGIAQTRLGETAAALDSLDLAAERFARREQTPRAAEALCALAEAWSHHGEWEVTPPRFGVSLPESPAHGRSLRRDWIRATRGRVGEFSGRAAALARIDLILARNLIEAGDAVARGVRVLESLAAGQALSVPVVEALLLLAEQREGQERYAAALALYRRVQRARYGAISARAERRANQMTRPQLHVEAPASVPAGRPVSISLRVRNLALVRLEVRRVDLEDWLTQERGALVEAKLPEAGAVAMSPREFDTRVDSELDWWDSQALGKTVSFEAPLGAYVAMAESRLANGRRIKTKKLLIISDLRAVAFAGSRQAVLWAERAAAKEPGDVTAHFWMHGTSFIPTRVEFNERVARLTYPPEARLARDKRWTCLIRDGEHLALCRGRLESRSGSPARDAVAMVIAPPAVRPGDVLRIAGFLLRGEPGPPDAEPAIAIEVELLDALDESVATREARVGPGGAFVAQFLVGSDWAGKQLHVLAHRQGRVVENVRGSVNVPVGEPDEARFFLDVELKTRFAPGAPNISATLRASYPWGTPLADRTVRYIVRALGLPATNAGGTGVWTDPVVAEPLGGERRLDTSGRFELSLAEIFFQVPDDPAAVGIRLQVEELDGRSVVADVSTLRGARPVEAWLGWEPPQPVSQQAVRFRFGWFDPTGRTATAEPKFEIRKDGFELAIVRAFPTPAGVESEAWIAPAPGSYEVVATLPNDTAEPLIIRRILTVCDSADDEAGREAAPRCEARFGRMDQKPGIRVQFEGLRAGPLLVLAEAGEPLAARRLSELVGAREVFLPAERYRSLHARVWLVGMDAGGVQRISRRHVRPEPERELELTLALLSQTLRPGLNAEVEITCATRGERPPAASIVARLIDARGRGTLHWMPGPTRNPSRGPNEPTLAPSLGMGGWIPDRTNAEADERSILSPALRTGLFQSATLWTDALAAVDGRARFSVPLPSEPGRYRLIVTARNSEGSVATQTLLLDATEGVRVMVDLPDTLQVGDRTPAAITISNTLQTPTAALVSVRNADGLAIESVRRLTQREPLRFSPDAGGYRLALQPGQRETLLVSLEAARAGVATLDVDVTAGGTKYTGRGTCRVTAPQQVDAAAIHRRDTSDEPGHKLALKRTVLTLTPVGMRKPIGMRTVTEEGLQSPEYVREFLRRGEAVAPGQLLLIRDEFTWSGDPLRNVAWEQRLPATCYTVKRDPIETRKLAEPRIDRLDSVSFAVGNIAPGAHIQEIIVLAIRPGSCGLAPPTVRVDGRTIPVDLDAEVTRIIVSESKP